MIPLNVQIPSFLISFIYGVFIFIFLELNYKFLYNEKLTIKIVSTLLIVLFISLLYFIIILKINYGIIHIYFFLSIILGYLFTFLISKKK